jgi:tRNA(adenine34) deaminase
MIEDNHLLWYMDEALKLASQAADIGEVPVAAMVLNPHGQEIARAFNNREKNKNPCGHAEILALQAASSKLKSWRLEGYGIVTTLEPCCMCYEVMVQSRVSFCIFGAYDRKHGALSTGHFLSKQHRKEYRKIIWTGGVKHFECGQILSSFFKLRRGQHLE